MSTGELCYYSNNSLQGVIRKQFYIHPHTLNNILQRWQALLGGCTGSDRAPTGGDGTFQQHPPACNQPP